MIKLSVIIISYNTKEITYKAITTLQKFLSQCRFQWEIIIVDNNSKDGSIELFKEIKKKHSNIKIIRNKKNLGYSKANNQGIKIAKGGYILFLNSDILIEKVNFEEILDFLDRQKKIGALTVRINLREKQLDWASHRGFPTPWNSFCYFLKLEKIFKSIPLLNRIFGGYHLIYKNFEKIHEIDSPSGAFYLTRKEILKKIGGFDEKFFMYGEDLDLSYRIKQLGYKIIYYPKYSVIHLKYASGIKKKDRKIQIKTKKHFFKAMKIFYQKNYQKNYPDLINKLIYLIIDWKIKNLK